MAPHALPTEERSRPNDLYYVKTHPYQAADLLAATNIPARYYRVRLVP